MKMMKEMVEVSQIANKKPNRKRKVRIFFYVDEKEGSLIQEKMAEANVSNREAYLRKMALSGYIIKLDFAEIRKMINLLSNASNNINQIARKVNDKGDIYAEDIKMIQAHQEKLWEQSDLILQSFSKL